MLYVVSFSAAFVAPATHTSEVWGRAQAEAAGVVASHVVLVHGGKILKDEDLCVSLAG